MDAQDIIVITIIAMAVGYSAWRIAKSFRKGGDCGCGCKECPHKKHC